MTAVLGTRANFAQRIDLQTPASFALDKVKFRESLPENIMQVDWVLHAPAILAAIKPECNILKLKNVKDSDVKEYLNVNIKVKCLVLHKTVEISDEALTALKSHWKVREVIDFRGVDKETKKTLKARQKEVFVDLRVGDFNKVVINPASKQERKIKIAFSSRNLAVLTDLLKEYRSLNSLKFVQVTITDAVVTDAILRLLDSSATKALFKKCRFNETEHQRVLSQSIKGCEVTLKKPEMI